MAENAAEARLSIHGRRPPSIDALPNPAIHVIKKI
jgi:hypothetical protein